MTRQRGGEDPEFGSDSFLDIIANIVGILIILIVIAGVKVARQPPPAITSDPVDAPPPISADADESPDTPASFSSVAESVSADHVQLLRDELLAVEEQTGDLERLLAQLEQDITSVVESSDGFRQDAAGIQAHIATLQKQSKEAKSVRATTSGHTVELQNELQTLREQAAAEDTRYQQLIQAKTLAFNRQQFAQEDLQDIAAQTQKLQEVIQEHQKPADPDAERLQHRLSPVASNQSPQELHFRLSSGRVSWVPLEPLLERLKRQVVNRVSLIRKFGQYQGICGPVGGYVMKYGIERVVASPLDALNGASGGYRIAVSRWTVTPTDELRAETVDEALKFGSRFRQVAEAADPDATMTVWLYASEFVHFRRLREFGHGLGLRVAARPLPDDAEITGSPGGSRSSAQ